MQRSDLHRPATLREGVDFTYQDSLAVGDLGNKFPERRTSVHRRLKRTSMSSRLIYRNGAGATGSIALYRKPGCETTGILFADSFGHRLVEFVAEHFGTLVHVHGTHFDAELVRLLQPSTVISEVTERFMAMLPMLEDEIPTELLFMGKIATGRMNPNETAGTRKPLNRRDLPPLLLNLVDRNDALAETVLAPDAAPSTTQEKFLGDIFDDANTADVIVAAFLAGRFRRPLQQGWRTRLLALPEKTRKLLAAKCGMPQPH
jgi:hypothetical protein